MVRSSATETSPLLASSWTSTPFQTTFLIPNLHCPTCVSHITSLIDLLGPNARVLDISIISHVVTVAHGRQVTAQSIKETLASAGYEIFDTIYNPALNDKSLYSTSYETGLERAVERWDPRRHSQVDETTRLLHDANCQMCAASNGHGELDSVLAGEPEDQAPLSVVTLSVEGMTCSSCVGQVTKALQEVSGVQRADVSLIGHSADVHFRGEDLQSITSQLVEAVEDAGYDAQLMNTRPAPTTGGKRAKAATNKSEAAPSRTVTIRIDGMHCPRCPKRICEELHKLDVEIEEQPTLESPLLTISYTPNAPSFTIRRILADIADLDPSFTVAIHKPLTVEQRSREMLAREQRSIFLRAMLSLITAVPTLIIGVVYMNLVSKDDPGYQYLMHQWHGVSRAEWAIFIMATPVYFFATDHFHRRMIKEVYALWRPRSPVPIAKRFYRFGSMNMLISLGTTIAYFASLAELIVSASNPSEDTLGASKQSYFDSVVFLTMFLLLGRLAEARMKAKSGDAISALGNLRPTEANLITSKDNNGFASVERVNVDLIDTGDLIKIPHGSSPPCDGVLLDEAADFDESSLTGESRIVHKEKDSSVFSGTINKGSAVTIRVSGPAGASMLDSIINVVREGQSKRAPMERIADLLTAYFVPVVVVIASATWAVWLALGLSGTLSDSYLDNNVGGWPFWSLQFAIAVFVIACPCGLGLAAPTALFVGGGMAAQRGILVKGGGEAFQEASTLDAVVFDKTGTLTEGVEPKIVEHGILYPGLKFSKAVLLGVLKGVEENSNHPLAKAAVNFVNLEDDEATAIDVSDADEIAGRGLKAKFGVGARGEEQQKYEALVGNEGLMSDYRVAIPEVAEESLSAWKTAGYSVVLLACRSLDGQWQLEAVFAASDPLRPEAADVVRSLTACGVDVWMLSGDNSSTANAVGRQVGIAPENIIAGVLPAEKAAKVQYLQRSLKQTRGIGFQSAFSKKRGRATVAMVGDGINDAPALAAADIGIAVASGSDVAVQSASFVLVNSDLRAVLTLVGLSRAVFRRVILNFFWAALYNMVALPVAAGVLYPITTSGGSHVRLDPAWAALAMALSSITVVASSLLLRTKIPWLGFRG